MTESTGRLAAGVKVNVLSPLLAATVPATAVVPAATVMVYPGARAVEKVTEMLELTGCSMAPETGVVEATVRGVTGTTGTKSTSTR